MKTQRVLQKILGDMDKIRQKDGSRNSDGNVPNANWNNDKFKVNYYNADNRNDNLRPREEISRKKELSRLLLCFRFCYFREFI